MAKHNMTGLLSLLAGKHGELVNVKLFRGHDDLVTPEELEEQMRSAVMQKKLGRASVGKHFPDSATEPVDINELVNSL